MFQLSEAPVWIQFVVLVFACFRTAILLSQEEGPFGIFLRLRAALGAFDYGPDGSPMTNLGRGISCPLCVGVYVAALMLMLAALNWTVSDALLAWLAVAGAQAFLTKVSE